MWRTVLLLSLILTVPAVAQPPAEQLIMTINRDVVVDGFPHKLEIAVEMKARGEKGDSYVTNLGLVKKSDALPIAEAIKVLSERIEKKPTAMDYHARAFAYRILKRPTAAKRDFSEGIRLDPTNALFYSCRAEIEYHEGNLEAAAADCDEVLRLTPKDAGIRAIKADIEKQLADKVAKTDAAISEATKNIKASPKFAANYTARAIQYYVKRDYEKAMADLNTAIRLKSNDGEALIWRGECHERNGDYEKAIADYRKAIKADPKRDDGYAKLGWMLATCPDPKFLDGREAVVMATKAKDLCRTEITEAYGILAAASAEAGDWDKAVDWQTKAIDANNFSSLEDLNDALELYRQKKPYRMEPVKKDPKKDSEKTAKPGDKKDSKK